MTLKMTIGANSFEFTGEATFAEVASLALHWLRAITQAGNLHEAIGELDHARAVLQAAVNAQSS